MRKIRVALIQFDAVPEAVDENVAAMKSWVDQACENGARWIMFHEGTLADYTPHLARFAEPVPDGPHVRELIKVAAKQDCFISFGLSEADNDNYYITQVFAGPEGFIYRYRKSWVWRDTEDTGYRNEWARYDPGHGPELFEFDDLNATCFICADGEAPRCIQRAADLNPDITFYPNNRGQLPAFEVFGKRAATIGSPMLVTNRTGKSWTYDCVGGCVVYGADGKVLTKANREGREEMLLYDLAI